MRKVTPESMRNRRAFTIIELLVVIGILTLLATLTVALFSVRRSDQMRSAARIVQSAILGAKDRALHNNGSVGVRLIRDLSNPTIATGLVYVQPLPIQTAQGITVDFASEEQQFAALEVILPNPTGQTWAAQDASGVWPPPTTDVLIQIPADTGNWYAVSAQSKTPPYWTYQDQNGLTHLELSSGFQGGNAYSPNGHAIDPITTPGLASCAVKIGQELMPLHQPMNLPANVIIDLKFSSVNLQNLTGVNASPAPAVPPIVDIMFAPRGSISGFIAAGGPLHFFLRNADDAAAGINPYAVGPPTSANPDLTKGDRLIVTLFPQTGLVQTFDMDPTDTNGDGLADDPFAFAKRGKSAGR